MRSTFEDPGSLERPRILGRLVRLLLGVACLDFVWTLLTQGGSIATAASAPSSVAWWLAVAFAFYVFSYVVNLGFTLDLGRWPQGIVATSGLLLMVWSLIERSSVWSPTLGWFLVAWLTYTYAHLGVSFLLASALATPGCEMRAIPHLLSLATHHPSPEHFCPGPLRFLDDWELGRASRRPG